MYNPNSNRFGDPEDQFSRPPRRNSSPMASASVTCALIGLLTFFTVYGALIFGSLAILFSLLSKGDRKKKERSARFAFMAGIIAVCIAAGMFVYSFVSVLWQYGSFSNYYYEYVQELEEEYGVDLGLDELFGEDSSEGAADSDADTDSDYGTDADTDTEYDYDTDTGTDEELQYYFDNHSEAL